MLTNIAQMRYLVAVACGSVVLLTVGCNKESIASSNQSDVNQPSIRSNRQSNRNSTAAPSKATIASASQTEATKSPVAKRLNGYYLVGHTGQGLEIDGDRYRYVDEEGAQSWRSITELTPVKDGVIYDGNTYWCLNTTKSKDEISSCSETGWVIYQPSSPAAETPPVLALEPGMTYEQARQITINAGWQPLITTTDNPDDGTKSWRERGFNEVSSCSGTGMGFCRFEFTGSGDQKLVIVTAGREATVQKWWQKSNQQASTEER